MNTKIGHLLHGLSLALIAILFIILFHQRTGSSGLSLQSNSDSAALSSSGQVHFTDNSTRSQGLPIAHINTDTVIQNLHYYHTLSAELEKKQRTLENELSQKARQYQSKEQDFIEKQNKGLLLRTEQQALYEELMQEQQVLMELRETMASELAEIEQVTYRKIVNRITSYLEKTYKGKYQYIFGVSFGGNILYGDTSSDITKEVIQGINQPE